MSQGISDSRFHMWRTLFAMAHVDHNVSKEEVRFMAEALEDIPFSDEQRKILREDSVESRDAVEMFQGVSDAKDQAEFFNFARTLVWMDGSYGSAEQEVLLKLKKLHVGSVKLDDLIDRVELEFAPDEDYDRRTAQGQKKRGLKSIIDEFIEQFREEKEFR